MSEVCQRRQNGKLPPPFHGRGKFLRSHQIETIGRCFVVKPEPLLKVYAVGRGTVRDIQNPATVVRDQAEQVSSIAPLLDIRPAR